MLLRGHVQLPSSLGIVPWAWLSFLDSLRLDFEIWPGPFLSLVGIQLHSVRLTTTPEVVFWIAWLPRGEILLPMSDAVGDLCFVGITQWLEKLILSLRKKFFLT